MNSIQAITWSIAAASLLCAVLVLVLRDFTYATLACLLNLLLCTILFVNAGKLALAAVSLWIIGGGVLLLLFILFALINSPNSDTVPRKYYAYKAIPAALVLYVFLRLAFLLNERKLNLSPSIGHTSLYDDFAIGLIAFDFFIFVTSAFAILRKARGQAGS